MPEDNKPSKYAQNPYVAPPHATELLLVRHGASQTYVPGEQFPMHGPQGDPALSPLGEQQAELVAARLAPEAIDAVYVTRLQRTSQTAAPLLRANGLTATTSPQLHEVFLGEWEGGIGRMKIGDKTDPIVTEVLASGHWDAVPGAERWTDFTARVKEGVHEIVGNHQGQNVVAFVHGGVIAAAGSLVVEAQRRFGSIDNCSVTHLVAHDEQIWLRTFNDTSHLRPLFTRS